LIYFRALFLITLHLRHSGRAVQERKYDDQQNTHAANPFAAGNFAW
jgi:hypothetical protein